MKKLISKSEAETQKIADKVMKSMPHGGVICLFGDLGSGKTVFAKGLAAALSIKKTAIKSPTYTLVREYPITKKRKFFHFDFYRMNEPDELMLNNLIEIFSKPENWIVIEWPERILPFLTKIKSRVHILMTYSGEKERTIEIQYHE